MFRRGAVGARGVERKRVKLDMLESTGEMVKECLYAQPSTAHSAEQIPARLCNAYIPEAGRMVDKRCFDRHREGRVARRETDIDQREDVAAGNGHMEHRRAK